MCCSPWVTMLDTDHHDHWSLTVHCSAPLHRRLDTTGHWHNGHSTSLSLLLVSLMQPHTSPPLTHSCSSQLLQLSDINHFTTAFTLLLMTAGEVCHERCYQRLWGVSSETAARRQVLLLWLLSLGKNSEVIEWVEQPGGSAQSAVLNLSSAQQQHDHLDQGEAKIVSKNAFHPQVYEC